MQLESFRVTNFRSINDSGDVKVERITALLGRNESGKTNLLLALKTLNPPEGYRDLNPVKDFPRHRRLEECKATTPVVSTRWKLNDADRLALGKIIGRASSMTHVVIGRNYMGNRWVGLEGLAPIAFDAAAITTKARRIGPATKAAATRAAEEKRPPLIVAADAFDLEPKTGENSSAWAERATKEIGTLRQALAAADVELSDKQESELNELESLAKMIPGDEKAQGAARTWAVESLPTFMFLDDYPELSGHQNIAEFLGRKANNKLTPSDVNFEKLCKVAGLDAQKVQELSSQNDPETRNQLANRASAVVTTEIRRLWKDRPLKVRFNLDGAYMDTFISDPNATYDVEVNLDERSRGFKWFFSFYITFSADTKGGSAEKAILLLDEPGLYLHAKSQSDLLVHFEKDFKNQILYTTHSPFMVPTSNLPSIRTVNIAEDKGTTVSNDPSGDARTLFPLQAALGYDIAQSLFIGPNNLVVEGVTDFWILSTISTYLADSKGTSLKREIALTPAGSAQKVSYMVALLTSQNLNTIVLLDDEKQSRVTSLDLIRSRLIRERNVVFVTEAVNPAPTEADIEDLLDAGTYEALVKESYKAELKGKTLKLNNNIPRIAKRIEIAFDELGLAFHKTRPSRLLMQKMANDPKSIVSPDVAKRFERLFSIINDRMDQHVAKGPEAFK
ncbi:MAG: AAA family ATPase [Rhizobiaceae bacterium]|nr:AAA family ATPase [Rhizobiaceae bacterium]